MYKALIFSEKSIIKSQVKMNLEDKGINVDES